MIENLLSGQLEQFFPEEVENLARDGSITLLDTRTVWEFQAGHIEGFINIPVDELRGRIGELDKGKPVYVMCQSGLRSYIACCILKGEGFRCKNLSGGYGFYRTIMQETCAVENAWPCGMEK